MKAVILAGGLGSRISEESFLKPKPMIEIGEHPIIWHIMQIYAAQGVNEFILCLGYKSYAIKNYFLNYHYYNSDLTVDLEAGTVDLHRRSKDALKVTMVETGFNTCTAGRLKRIEKYLEDDESFFLTYGDGLANVNLSELVTFHKNHGCAATVTAVQPAGRYGAMQIAASGLVANFQEKTPGDGGWLNGGFFVFNSEVFSHLPDNADNLMLEPYLLTRLSVLGQLYSYHHLGFWKCMDTVRDKAELEDLWAREQAPWKIWP